MGYGFIALVGSIALTAVYVLVTDAAYWLKALIAALLAVSLMWRFGLYLQVAISIFILYYLTYLRTRG